jgi:hypothetical protein
VGQRLIVVRDRLVVGRPAEPEHRALLGELPQPAEQPAGAPPREHDPAVALDPHQRPREERQLALRPPRRRDRQLVLAPCAARLAQRRERAGQAARRRRRAQ